MKQGTDDLEKYYDYNVRDDSEIEKELKHKRNDKISTVAAIIAIISLVFGTIFCAIAVARNDESSAIITLILYAVMIVSAFVGSAFDDDIHY